MIVFALGIGVASAFFSVFHSVVLNPLPYPKPDRLIRIERVELPSGQRSSLHSYPAYQAWREGSASLEAIGAYQRAVRILMSSSGSELLQGYQASAELLKVLGVPALKGRLFEPDDFQPQAPLAVVVGERWWRTRFGGDSAVLGESINLNGQTYAVIGVVADQYTAEAFPQGDFWVPLRPAPSDSRVSDPQAFWLQVVARLKPQAGLEAAEEELTRQMQALSRQGNERRYQASLALLKESLIGNRRPVLNRLFFLMAVVLLVACINASALMLIKTTCRSREFAVRTALGAGLRHVVGLVMAENLLLGLLGGSVGVLAAFWTLPLLNELVGAHLPRSLNLSLNPWFLAFGVGISVLCGLVAGILPAIRLLRTDFSEEFNSRLRSKSEHHLGRMRLIAAEMAVSVALLFSAGLLLKDFRLLASVDMGYQVENVLSFAVNPMGEQYAGAGAKPFFDRVLRELESLPSVASAGICSAAPLTADSDVSVGIGLLGASRLEELKVFRQFISDSYLPTMGIALVSGRRFDRRDHDSARRSAMVTESVAGHLGAADLVGREIATSFGSFKIVGVAADVKQYAPSKPAPMIVYLPFEAYPREYMHVVIKTEAEPEGLSQLVREKIIEIEPMAPLIGLSSLEKRFQEVIASPRLTTALVSLLAALTLCFTISGLYAVVSESVNQRMIEMGIRSAVGANRFQILRLVMLRGLRMIAAGLVAGGLLAAIAAQILQRFLHGIEAYDLTVFLLAAIFIASAVLLASLEPALRAARLNPAEILRVEI